MRLFIVAALCCAYAVAQEPVECAGAGRGSGSQPCQAVLNYSGSNLTSICYAIANLATRSNKPGVSISAATNANPVVFTSTAHGLAIGSRPTVTVSGGTGNWTGVNVTKVATIVDANSFSIAVDSTTFGAVTGTLVFTSTAPRSGQAEWAVKALAYDGSNNNIGSFWLNGNSTLTNKCSDAALTTTNIQ